MTTVTPKSLKRKHVHREIDTGASGSVKKSKGERQAEKRAKRESEAGSPVRRKGQAGSINTQATADERSTVSGSQFKLVRARTEISVPPRFVGDTRRGVEEILDNLVMRYVPSLEGILLSHKNHTFVQDVAIIYAEGPFPTTTVDFDAAVWAPEVGMRIVGRISLHATDHIGLLVHRTFNASIGRAHIPDNGEWEYVHGPTANDPEFGAEGVQGDEERGRWVHTQTGQTLGGESGLVEFTVIGYTVANQMLSLHGSLQLDPFAPEHYATKQNGVRIPEDDEPGTGPEDTDDALQERSDDEVEVMEEETAAPRGKRRKVVDVVPVAPGPEFAPTKKKRKKKSVANGEATVIVAEAATTTAEGEKKNKRKKEQVHGVA